jgi:hypothetical protein
MSEWLASLKVGDEVAIQPGGWDQTQRISRVTRITKTQFVCGSERFRKSDGWAPGSGWSRPNIVKPTQEMRDKIEAARLRTKIKNAATDSTTTLATLRAMAAALKEP